MMYKYGIFVCSIIFAILAALGVYQRDGMMFAVGSLGLILNYLENIRQAIERK
jgi:hypothetical protein